MNGGPGTDPRLAARHALIAGLVPEGARVLDVGCGDGVLLARLAAERGARGYGLEIDGADVARAVARGLSVVQGDAEADLQGYPDAGFGAVVLSNSLQALRAPVPALRQAVRVGERAVVSFPNFGHWRVRASLARTGRMPRSRALPQEWHETENIHLCTVLDFLDLCRAEGMAVDAAYGVNGARSWPFTPERAGAANLRAQEAVFVVRQGCRQG